MKIKNRIEKLEQATCVNKSHDWHAIIINHDETQESAELKYCEEKRVDRSALDPKYTWYVQIVDPKKTSKC